MWPLDSCGRTKLFVPYFFFSHLLLFPPSHCCELFVFIVDQTNVPLNSCFSSTMNTAQKEWGKKNRFHSIISTVCVVFIKINDLIFGCYSFVVCCYSSSSSVCSACIQLRLIWKDIICRASPLLQNILIYRNVKRSNSCVFRCLAAVSLIVYYTHYSRLRFQLSVTDKTELFVLLSAYLPMHK